MAKYKHTERANGDTILSKEWNAMGQKIESINNKFDDEKGIITGSLNIADNLMANNSIVARRNAQIGGMLNVSGTVSINGATTFAANVQIPRSRLGVGTTNPKGMIDARLDLKGKLGGNIAVSNFAGGLNTAASMDFRTFDTGSSDPSARILAVDNNAGSNNVFIQTKIPGNRSNRLATRLAISADGKVGINTANPVDALHVVGPSRVGNNQNETLRMEPQKTFHRLAFNHLRFYEWNVGKDMATFNNGNIGIGATAPISPLHVYTAVDAAVTLQSADNGYLYTQYFDKSKKRKAWVGFDNGMSSFNIALENGASNIILRGGNVGVGSTAPSAKLHVAHSAQNANGNAIKITVPRGAELRMGCHTTYSWIQAHASKPLRINELGNNTIINPANGAVGIGTNTPKDKLNIVNGFLRMGTTEAEGMRLETWKTFARIAYSDLRFWDWQNGGDMVTFNNNRVGIMTTSPNDTLEVKGTLRLSSSVNFAKLYCNSSKRMTIWMSKSGHGNTKYITWDGDTNWDGTSDKSLKTNIEEEKDILSRVLKLKVKNYNWKDEPNASPKPIGMIAQDVKPHFPALVGEGEDPETNKKHLTLKYANFGVLAIGAIKELKEEKDTEIAALKAELKKLKKQLNAK